MTKTSKLCALHVLFSVLIVNHVC